MIKEGLKKGELYVNYLGPSSAALGSLVATPILISNLGLKEWSLFALVNILLPLAYFIIFGKSQIVRRLMINVILSNHKAMESINKFYEFEKKNFLRFIPIVIFFSFLLIFFNLKNYQSFVAAEFSLILVSIAVLIKMFEIYYDATLNGLKMHYKLNISSSFVTIMKWIVIVYLSFNDEIGINVILITVIIFSLILICIQRILIKNVTRNILPKLNNQKNTILELKETDFGIVVLLIMLLQQFDKVLVFGILDPLSLSYFGIAFMLSSIIPMIISPLVGYFTPEIYQAVEKNLKDRKKYFSMLLLIQFIVLFAPLTILNVYLEPILKFWLGNNVDSMDILFFLIPMSLGALSISLLNSIKVLFIGENKIIYIKKPLVLLLFFLILLSVGLYLEILTVIFYIYCWSISLFILNIYFYFVFFKKNIYN